MPSNMYAIAILYSLLSLALAQTVMMPSGPTEAPSKPLIGSALLYDQLQNCSQERIAVQFYTDLGKSVDCADDFVVPLGEPWTVDHLKIEGRYVPLRFDIDYDNYTVLIMEDDGGKPNATVCRNVANLLSTVTQLDLSFSFSGEPCVLQPGTYWVQILPNVPLGSSPATNQFFWSLSETKKGEKLQWRDKDSLFSSATKNEACEEWTNGNRCFTLSETDLCFGIYGSNQKSSSVLLQYTLSVFIATVNIYLNVMHLFK